MLSTHLLSKNSLSLTANLFLILLQLFKELVASVCGLLWPCTYHPEGIGDHVDCMSVYP